MEPLFSKLDHLVYAAPDVSATINDIGALFGVRPEIGGKHPGWGTMNALLSIGPRMYLEILGPDPDRPNPKQALPFNLDRLVHPRLVSWVARVENLRAVVECAKSEGIDLGEIQEKSRQRPDGVILKWSMTDLTKDREGGIVPYFINWGDSPHPAETSPRGCTLTHFRAMHPDPDRLTKILNKLGLDVIIDPGPTGKLVATIETPSGRFDLE
jgi:hypothetical protein